MGSNENFINKHFSAIITGIISVAAVFISYFEYHHSVNRTKNEEDMRKHENKINNEFQSQGLSLRRTAREQAEKLNLLDFIMSKRDQIEKFNSDQKQGLIDYMLFAFDNEQVERMVILLSVEEGFFSTQQADETTKTVKKLNEQSLKELIKPISSNINSSEKIYRSYKDGYEYQYATDLYKLNAKNIEILNNKKDLIPLDLREESELLKTHYSAWNKEYLEKKRSYSQEPKPDERFQIIHSESTFPIVAAERFKSKNNEN